jgi:DNA polymerase
MNTDTNTRFLKEMGITQWTSRELPIPASEPHIAPTEDNLHQNTADKISFGTWWFFGNKPQGDAQVLFTNIVRVLGLNTHEWSWKIPTDKINPLEIPQDGEPIVAVAFGGLAAQKLSGEKESLPDLRETILAMSVEGAQEIALIATFELNQLLSKPKDKRLLWQDLLLAKSVLLNC